MKTSEFEQGYLAGRVEQQVIIDDQAKSIESLRRQLVDANQDLDDMKEAALIFAHYYKSKLAEQFETLRKALNKIAKLDPKFDSDEGFNEWGEADCFRKAQKIAIAATKPKEQGK